MALAKLQSQTTLEKPSCSVIDLSSDDGEPSPRRVDKRVKREVRHQSEDQVEAETASDDGWASDSDILNDLLENGAEMKLVPGIFNTRGPARLVVLTDSQCRSELLWTRRSSCLPKETS